MTGVEVNSASSQHKAIERASKIKNPIEPFADQFSKYTKDDIDLTIYCKWKGDMDAKTLKWAMKLAERNVAPFYRTCGIGWQPKEKQRDLNKNWARYLVAVDKAKQPVAYTMFRFDMDYGCSVLYCYELQIEKEYQRKGLGKFFIDALERMAKQYGMEKLILTVLSNNEDGIKFFNSMGFTTDDTSPDAPTDYSILSKSMDSLQLQAL
ncbi:N-alpha-acetyltransferase 40 [Bradysia coprophila]|uniref:N-alpha-acetyltransferase 40 n=1 Tax=Bradysia coprophila TaxID=38358 RepID=UPI00187D937F|nr:N-alpha-acetyltransferase 40 [Bradysia coprophila]